MTFDLVIWTVRRYLVGRHFCRPRSGARGWRALVTQSSLRVALGYILSPPSEAEQGRLDAVRAHRSHSLTHLRELGKCLVDRELLRVPYEGDMSVEVEHV